MKTNILELTQLLNNNKLRTPIITRVYRHGKILEIRKEYKMNKDLLPELKKINPSIDSILKFIKLQIRY